MKSIGNILKKQREQKKFELTDIHKFIKIHPKFLKALEEDDYSVFSNKIHAKGFLKVYADFLKLDVNQILAIWRREYGGQFDRQQEGEEVFKLKEISPPKFLITPGIILIIIATILVLGFFGYLFYQYRNYSGVPGLTIHSPDNNIVVNSSTLDITGETDMDSVVLINNQRIIVDKDGSFATSVNLHEGINTLSFLAVNKLGREKEEIRTIIYRKDPEPPEKIDGSQEDQGNIEDTKATAGEEGSATGEGSVTDGEPRGSESLDKNQQEQESESGDF